MAVELTLGNMIDQIADETTRAELKTNTVFSIGPVAMSSIRLAIFQAIFEYQREHFYFNELAYDTWPAVVNQETYTEGAGGVPDDILKIVSLSTVYSGTRLPLVRRSWEWVEDRQTSTITGGQVTDYAYFATAFRMYPIPTSAQTFSLAYVQKVAAPAATTDGGPWINEAGELIRVAAKKRLYQHTLAMPEDAASMAQAEAMALAAVRRETRLRLGTGRVKATQF